MRRGLGFVLCLFLLLVGGGCGGGGRGTLLPRPEIMFFNASPDAASVDFFLDSDILAAAIAFGSGSDFSVTDPESRDIGVNDAGTTTQYDLIFQALERNKHYVVSSIGLVNFGNEFEKRLRLFPLEVNRHFPQGTKSRLIVIHGFCRAVGFQTPNLDFQNPGDNPQYKAADIAFAASATLEIDASVQTFEARRAGSQEVFATLNNFSFGAGKVYLVYVVGVEGEVGNQIPQILVHEIPAKDYP